MADHQINKYTIYVNGEPSERVLHEFAKEIVRIVQEKRIQPAKSKK